MVRMRVDGHASPLPSALTTPPPYPRHSFLLLANRRGGLERHANDDSLAVRDSTLSVIGRKEGKHEARRGKELGSIEESHRVKEDKQNRGKTVYLNTTRTVGFGARAPVLIDIELIVVVLACEKGTAEAAADLKALGRRE